MAVVGVVAAMGAGEARADEMAKPQPTGTAWLVVGGGLVGLGVLNMATAPVCHTKLVDSRAADVCTGLSLGVGAVLAAAGVPMVVVGAGQRAAWLKGLPVPSVAPTQHGAVVGFTGTW